MTIRKIGRDASSGRLVTERATRLRRTITVLETVSVPNRKRRVRAGSVGAKKTK